MRRILIGASCLILLAACSPPPAAIIENPVPPPTAPVPASGIDFTGIDSATRVQDNLYQHFNGTWLATTEIPADRPGYGAFSMISDRTQDRLRGLVEDAAKQSAAATATGDRRRIGDLYASFMDENRLDAIGLKPLDEEFALINAMTLRKDVPALIGTLGKHLSQARDGNPPPYTLPFVVVVHQDNKDSTRYVADLEQSGLGMPDRDYYLNDDDPKLVAIRSQYLQHVEKMLTLEGEKDPAKKAKDILALETELARIQWTKVELRDPQKAYNKIRIADLHRLAPKFDWSGFVKAADIEGKTDYVIVGQPSYISGLAKIVNETPLPIWKAYFRWHVLNDYAPMLDKAAVDEHFAFYGTDLYGIPENRPRWKRGISLVDTAMGEALGKLYVARYFPPRDKEKAEVLVQNLLTAFARDIDTLDWMGPATKQQAQAKLAKIAIKIGYPDKWRDYSQLMISRDNLIGNVRHAYSFEYAREINKLRSPIDRGEWGMTPQLVNAEYNPELNDITFPAAILQPPFFNPQSDDAANYGAIGAIIGHEISHAFDDQGAQYDGDGNLRDWWTPADHEKFAAKTKALVAEYNGFSPLPGYTVNGELTLGENIADNSGLAVAYKAYRMSLGGKDAPIIDGMTGDQRFYAGFAEAWRFKMRDNALIAQLKTDPHSPPQFRANGTVVNQPPFYDAFGVKPGDKMYVAPENRVIIW